MVENFSPVFKRAWSFLVLLAIALLIGISFYSSIQTLKSTSNDAAEMVGDDMVTDWDKHLRKIRQILPDHGVIGYLADWDIPDYITGAKDQEVEFILAQYTVAPLVLERGIRHDVVLGNFSDDGDSQKIQRIQEVFGIHLIEKFSNEIIIFRGPGQ
jgi:hypothetical protein